MSALVPLLVIFLTAGIATGIVYCIFSKPEKKQEKKAVRTVKEKQTDSSSETQQLRAEDISLSQAIEAVNEDKDPEKKQETKTAENKQTEKEEKKDQKVSSVSESVKKLINSPVLNKEEEKSELPLENQRLAKKEEAVDYSLLGEEKKKEVLFRYSEIALYLKIHVMDHCLLVEWRGPVSEEEKIVFVMDNAKDADSLFQAETRIMEEKLLQRVSPLVVLPYTSRLEAESVKETETFLLANSIRVTGALLNGSDIEHIDHTNAWKALIGTRTAAYMEISVNGNPQRSRQWLSHVRSDSLFEMHATRDLMRSLDDLGVSFWKRMLIKLFPSKYLPAVLKEMPGLRFQAQASLIKKDERLILQACNDALLMEALAKLGEDASRYSLYLEHAEVRHSSQVVPSSASIYQRVKKAAEGSFKAAGVSVCAKRNENTGLFTSVPCVRFVPAVEGKREDRQSAVSFYLLLLSRE